MSASARRPQAEQQDIAELIAPGYQGELFRPPASARPRWRAVRPDGTRLPSVAQLGVVIAQAAAIASREGAAWIVGADHHTVEVRTGPTGLRATAGEGAPRWVATVRAAMARASRPPTTPPPR